MRFNSSIYRVCCLFGGFALFTTSACDKEATDAKSAPEIEKVLKDDAKELYDSAKPEDCPTFAKELQDACSSIVDKRTDIKCKKYLIQFETAQAQADGKLFDAGAQNAKVASAVCGKSVKRLREDVAKAKPDSLAWAPACNDYLATIRKDCLTKIATGTQAKHCQQTIQMLEMAIGKDDGAMACSMGTLHFKK